MAVAGRIRVSFQQDARFVDGQRIAATVSVGVAIRAGHAGALADLLASADGALYRSKRQGRNRVTLADDQSGEAEIGNVVRIA
jgi:diguanylate cyclase (GGDEF)-like protein